MLPLFQFAESFKTTRYSVFADATKSRSAICAPLAKAMVFRVFHDESNMITVPLDVEVVCQVLKFLRRTA